MRTRLRFIIGVAVIMAAIGYLIATAIHSTSEYYLTVNEVAARQSHLHGQTIRVGGRVKPGTIRWDPISLTLAFTLMPLPPTQGGIQRVASDPPALYRVVCKGEPKPDMLAGNRDVIVEGRIGKDDLIDARQVMTKCPSKYIPEKTK
ncbi:MAG: cytochrome c maturation protein CcmE [Candidatus Binataceae bacterium]